MGLVTEDAVRSLAAFKATKALVVTVYLDVDGKRHPRRQDYEASLERLFRESEVADPAVISDLQRIGTFVRAGIDRSHVRGLVVFACEAHDLWQVIELSVPVRDQLVVNHTPHVRQLEAIIHNHQRFGVLVADRQRARMFVFEQGDLVDHSEAFDQLPRHDDHGAWDRDHVRDHTDALAHAHLKRAAQLAFVVYQHRGFDHLLLAVPTEMASELERELHTYLRDRIAARLSIPPSASVAQITDAAMAVDADFERTKEAAIVDRLCSRLGANSGAAAGLDGVLAALSDRRVDTLVVSDGYVAPGWRCSSCEHVATKGRRCPNCGENMHPVDDVLEEAVEVALGQSCRVVTCTENADLDVHGRVGALLRY